MSSPAIDTGPARAIGIPHILRRAFDIVEAHYLGNFRFLRIEPGRVCRVMNTGKVILPGVEGNLTYGRGSQVAQDAPHTAPVASSVPLGEWLPERFAAGREPGGHSSVALAEPYQRTIGAGIVPNPLLHQGGSLPLVLHDSGGEDPPQAGSAAGHSSRPGIHRYSDPDAIQQTPDNRLQLLQE